MSNQAFAQQGQIRGGGGNGAAQPRQIPINGGNGGDGSVIVKAFGSEALFGQPASNSGNGGHSRLGQIQTHPIKNYARTIGIQIQPFIRNILIPAAQQHGYGIGLGIGVLHKDTP